MFGLGMAGEDNTMGRHGYVGDVMYKKERQGAEKTSLSIYMYTLRCCSRVKAPIGIRKKMFVEIDAKRHQKPRVGAEIGWCYRSRDWPSRGAYSNCVHSSLIEGSRIKSDKERHVLSLKYASVVVGNTNIST